MAALVTLKQASDHLRLDLEFTGSPPEESTDPRTPDLQLKLDAAEAIVLDYLKVGGGSPSWEAGPDDLPIIQAAILLVLSGLFDDREGAGDGDYLKEDGAVARLLRRLRDPALA
jgi:hypothetical protein